MTVNQRPLMVRLPLLLSLLLPVGLSFAQADVRLPDGAAFTFWHNTTTYSKTYVVDQTHPRASDDNPGTAEAPFRTINRAAQVVATGERVLIKAGVYREKVVPRQGGSGPDAMISYEAAPGARVLIKGSRVLPPAWVRSMTSVQGDDPWAATFSEKLWMITLPDSLFPERNPFTIPNADAADMEIMPWAQGWTGRVPYTLPRGLVFQDERRLVQLSTYEDLVRVPGAFWVDTTQTVLHIHPYGGQDPNEAVMEVTVQAHLFKPDVTDIGYIQVKGITFMHAGNGFPRTGVGALFTMGGHHWIIENNRFEGVNSVAVEIGARSIETADQAASRSDWQRAMQSPGQVIVRGNVISDAGTGGIQGYVLMGALVDDNHLYDIGWQDVERYWENAAVKLLRTTDTLVRRNLIHDVQAGSAIWLDWDIRNSRITRNTVYDLTMCCNGALFIEAAQVPNLIDHNILWDIHGVPIYTGDADSLTIAYNLIGPSTGPGVLSKVGTNRMLNGRPLTSRHNRIVHNVFYKASPMVIEDPANTSNLNVFSGEFDLHAWRAEGFDADSWTEDFDVSFDPNRVVLHLRSRMILPRRTGLPLLDADFYEVPRRDTTTVGPFQGQFAHPVVLNVDPRSPHPRQE